jgi:hypothetical protein
MSFIGRRGSEEKERKEGEKTQRMTSFLVFLLCILSTLFYRLCFRAGYHRLSEVNEVSFPTQFRLRARTAIVISNSLDLWKVSIGALEGFRYFE